MTGMAEKTRRPAVTFHIRLRGDEWQVCHGNRIIHRSQDEDKATDILRSILNVGGRPVQLDAALAGEKQ